MIHVCRVTSQAKPFRVQVEQESFESFQVKPGSACHFVDRARMKTYNFSRHWIASFGQCWAKKAAETVYINSKCCDMSWTFLQTSWVCLIFFIISPVSFCLQFAGLKIRNWREISYLVKQFCDQIRLCHPRGVLMLKCRYVQSE